jgi:hypothetical protein
LNSQGRQKIVAENEQKLAKFCKGRETVSKHRGKVIRSREKVIEGIGKVG